MNLIFHLTDMCNLRCSYCYQINKSRNHVMTFDMFKQIIDNLFPINYDLYGYYMVPRNGKEITTPILRFFGGEALLHIDLIQQVVDYFNQRILEQNIQLENYQIVLDSNGVLLKTKKVEEFIKKYKDHVNLNLSLDGVKEIHDSCRVFEDGTGSFDIVDRNIKYYLQTYPDVMKNTSIRITIPNVHLERLYDGYIYMYEQYKGVKEIQYCPVMPKDLDENYWNDETSQMFKEQMLKIGHYLMTHNNYEKNPFFDTYKLSNIIQRATCGTCGDQLAFDWNGNIFTCQRFCESSITNKKSMAIGNIYDGITEGGVYVLNKIRLAYPKIPQKCLSCRASHNICGFCPAMSFDYCNDPDMKTRLTVNCKVKKAELEVIDTYRREKKLNKNEV